MRALNASLKFRTVRSYDRLNESRSVMTNQFLFKMKNLSNVILVVVRAFRTLSDSARVLITPTI